MNKNSDSLLSNLDDETVEEISNMVNGMDDKMKERIIKQCSQKMNQADGNTSHIRVCSNHKWYRSGIAATAAGLIIVAGIGFFAVNGINKISQSDTDKCKSENSFENSVQFADKDTNDDKEMSAADDADNTADYNSVNENQAAQADESPENDEIVNPVTTTEDTSHEEDKNITQTDMNAVASQLISDFYDAYRIVGFGRIEFNKDDYITQEGSDFHYCKSIDPAYKSIDDLQSLLSSCLTENAIDQKGYKDKLYGEYPTFVMHDGNLYVKDRPTSWPLNITDTPAQINKVSDTEYYAVKEYDNFGATEHITFKIINTDNGWKIDSYTADYENEAQ